ncbi:hypothetical protein C4J81_07790 [Deltaproteobacteria bacterium Smac51]|nr:hypothetical protein C4J81_07790 [Deltaproteobacteria bacterium Smac51]
MLINIRLQWGAIRAPEADSGALSFSNRLFAVIWCENIIKAFTANHTVSVGAAGTAGAYFFKPITAAGLITFRLNVAMRSFG